VTITGLYVPLITPFDESGGLDLNCLRALAHAVLDGGATGLVALGTTAEPSALTPPERATVLGVIATACAQRHAPLIVGANSASEFAQLDGVPAVTAALTLVPPFLRPGEDGVVAYFETIVPRSPVPVLVYHVPHRTGQELSTRTIGRLANVLGIVGMKFAPGALGAEELTLFADPPEEFAILGGDDLLLSPMLALGAHGAIAASAHIGTAAYAALISAWHAGDTAARALGHQLALLSAALFAEPNPTVIKAVLHAQGRLPTPSVRLPLTPAAPATVDMAIRAAEAVAGQPTTGSGHGPVRPAGRR
jgi:4-hydroxy-tetrahydrodipicolinate synthase